jgi:hypothetical protein
MRVRAKSIDLMPKIQEHLAADMNEDVDYKLKEKSKASIMIYCQNDVYSDLLACLGKYLLKPDVDTKRRQIVFNRKIT